MRGTTTGARLPGAVVAGATALVSGVSVFVNGYGVRAVHQATVYTTAKNMVATVLLLGVVAVVRARGGARGADASARRGAGGPGPGVRRLGPAGWLGLAYVGAVGGGLAFVLFFAGLSRSAAEPAAFLHDTLVVWVALLAWPTLRERLSPWNVAAVVLLVAGQVAVSGGIGHLVAGGGAGLVLAATILWAVETVVAKRLLAVLTPWTLAAARMGIGVGVLLVAVAATGRFGMLTGLDAGQLRWVLVTGLLLAAYVATWMLALSRARALDVTSVLVGSVVVTALLDAATGHGGLAPEALGLVLVALGTGAVLVAWPRRLVTK